MRCIPPSGNGLSIIGVVILDNEIGWLVPGIAPSPADLAKLWNTEGLAIGYEPSVLVSKLSGNGFGRLTDVVIVVVAALC